MRRIWIIRRLTRYYRILGTPKDIVVTGILVGVLVGLFSVAFYYMLTYVEEMIFNKILNLESYPDDFRWYLTPFIVGVGGLISGFLVYTFAPEAEGHGTDAVIDAFHRRGGYIRLKASIIKFFASISTIGFGGSAGKEGPMAQIGGGLGSTLARIFNSPISFQRIATIAGLAAGIGSMFKAPLGAAIFSIEVLYKRDFESEGLISSFIAAIMGYLAMGIFTGYEHIFLLPYLSVENIIHVLFYASLGLASALVGILYVKTFNHVRNIFRGLAVSNHYKPFIGGLVTGLLGMVFPQVLGSGYKWLREFSDGSLKYIVFNRSLDLNIEKSWMMLIPLMTILIIAKILATSFSIGSGGSGGVFAPGIFIGGLTGLILASLYINLFPQYITDKAGFLSSFMIVGMVSLFGGISKAPLAVLIMVSEMTGSYELMAPAMLSISISYFLTGDTTIYDSQVVDRSKSPAHWRHV